MTTPDEVTAWTAAIGGVFAAIFGGWKGASFIVDWNAGRKAKAVNDLIEAVNAARNDERDDCGRQLARMDAEIARLDKRLEGCEERHNASNELIAELATRFGMGGVADRARSITPGAFPKVDPAE